MLAIEPRGTASRSLVGQQVREQVTQYFLNSLFYRVETKDFYDDLAANPNIMRFMDTSNLPSDHKCYSAVRKRILGLFKNETDSRTVYEFAALRAKSYAYDVEQNVCIRAKGVMGHSPQLFPEIYNPANYTLRVAEHVVTQLDTLGFTVGQRFPWTSLDTSQSLQDAQQFSWELAGWNSPTVLNLISGRFPNDDDVIRGTTPRLYVSMDPSSIRIAFGRKTLIEPTPSGSANIHDTAVLNLVSTFFIDLMVYGTSLSRSPTERFLQFTCAFKDCKNAIL
ncbi:hypothetical protein QTP88_012268 [Uroleucon formosanum]